MEKIYEASRWYPGTPIEEPEDLPHTKEPSLQPVHSPTEILKKQFKEKVEKELIRYIEESKSNWERATMNDLPVAIREFGKKLTQYKGT